MKASRRKITQKKANKDLRNLATPQNPDLKNRPFRLTEKILNLKTNKIEIPERRGTIIGESKQYSSLQDIKMIPSEIDLKAERDIDSSNN